jgi:hypothetical protein
MLNGGASDSRAHGCAIESRASLSERCNEMSQTTQERVASTARVAALNSEMSRAAFLLTTRHLTLEISCPLLPLIIKEMLIGGQLD